MAVGAAVVAGALAAPALATAASDYYVTPTGNDNAGMNSCTDPTAPCKTIANAVLNIEFDSSSPKTLHIAAVSGGVQAVYNENVDIGNNPNFNNVTIDGSYLGGAGQRALVSVTTNPIDNTAFEDDGANDVVENLDITTSATMTDPLHLGGSGTVLRNVNVSVTNSGNTFANAEVNGENQVWDHVDVSSNAQRVVVQTAQDDNLNWALTDSSITGTNDPADATHTSPVLKLFGPATLTRDTISAPQSSIDPAVGVFGAASISTYSATMQDTLVIGGNPGIWVKDVPIQPSANHLTVRFSTIDAGTLGADSAPGAPSILASALNAASTTTVDVSNSILVDGAGIDNPGGSTPQVNCTHTNVPATSDAPGCQPTGTGNINAAPSTLLLAPGSFDYHLAPGSPAIDAGSPLAAGDSTTDLDGNPRVVAINSCTPTPDLGAYELQSPVKVCPPPTVSITSPANGATFTQGQVVHAAYSCAEGAGGPGILSCVGPVAVGAAIDTSKLGAHAFAVTATSKSGKTGSSMSSYTVIAASTPPKLTAVRESRSKWHAGKAGATFSFTLNEPARVVLAYTRTVAGRRVHGKCIAPSKRNKHDPGCKRSLSAGSSSLAARAGANSLQSKRLRPGSYRVTLVAVSASGQRSAPATLTFTVLN